jgi:hypothetical protein
LGSRPARLTTLDPMGFAAGSSNLYEAMGNDATNATDPTGLYTLNVSFTFTKGLGGFITNFGFTTAIDTSVAGQNVTLVGQPTLVGSQIDTIDQLGFGTAFVNAILAKIPLLNAGQLVPAIDIKVSKIAFVAFGQPVSQQRADGSLLIRLPWTFHSVSNGTVSLEPKTPIMVTAAMKTMVAAGNTKALIGMITQDGFTVLSVAKDSITTGTLQVELQATQYRITAIVGPEVKTSIWIVGKDGVTTNPFSGPVGINLLKDAIVKATWLDGNVMPAPPKKNKD